MLLHIAKVFAPMVNDHLHYRNRLFLLPTIWKRMKAKFHDAEPYLGVACVALLIYGAFATAHNNAATWKLMTGTSIGDVEHTLTDKGSGRAVPPISRLIFSVYANSLTSKQITKLGAAADNVKVDSCTYRSPNIVLIIGESYSRHHSQQYGYFMNTTPRQIAREKDG